MFIAIEGIDGAGKATQVELLVRALGACGYPCVSIDFPQYRTTKAGARLREWLDGKHGDFVHMDARTASTFYAYDRLESAHLILQPLQEDAIVVADRYTGSNQIHQGGKFKEEKERIEFLDWLDWFEHGVLKNPRPDLVIFLDMPVETSVRLLVARSEAVGTPLDQVEKSRHYLEDGRHMAQWLAARNEHWRLINCADIAGELRSREAIHRDVRAALVPFLPLLTQT